MHQPARLAQLVERVTSNHEVASSNLAVSRAVSFCPAVFFGLVSLVNPL